MCDASEVALGVVLGKRRDKILHPIYYASKALKHKRTILRLNKSSLRWYLLSKNFAPIFLA